MPKRTARKPLRKYKIHSILMKYDYTDRVNINKSIISKLGIHPVTWSIWKSLKIEDDQDIPAQKLELIALELSKFQTKITSADDLKNYPTVANTLAKRATA